MTTRGMHVRRMLAAVTAAGLLAMTVSCATDSPPEQSARERKAASVPVFKLHMSKDLWTRTNNAPGHNDLDKPQSLTEDPNGMATIELTGPQMVDYLKTLDYNAHGGIGAFDEPLAVTVYDTVAPVIDQIQAPPAPGASVPEITVHAAVAPTTSPAPSGGR
ncbi:hypothetical protein [Nocardia brasiliensis]|uniref:hypothetical protein n=1 Tax=Nocardia brasiliensis TaxID=37326 RepID=UPI00189350B6|nr:hypothetical protein [Nocardia brasiliensis]MBF6548848.1 hypothetical protein [Nocardia brasiliensis]